MKKIISILFFTFLYLCSFSQAESHDCSGECYVKPDYTTTINVKLPLATEQTEVKVDVRDGIAFIEGDIAIGKVNELELRGVASDIQRWTNATIPYQIAGGFSAQQIANINNAAQHISDNTNVCVVPRTGEANYLELKSSNVCNSFVGMQGGRQEINLASGCGFGSTVHEFLHAIGIWHEQSREDRDNHVTIHTENITAGNEHNFNKQTHNASDYGSYDYNSIMHYSAFAFSKNGQRTITTIPAGTPIGQRSALSQGDIATINAMYTTPCGNGSNSSRYEAENATLVGVSTSTSILGFSGTGHALGSTFKDSGDRIRFTVNVPSAGSYPLTIRYYNHGNNEKYQNISINGGSNKYTRFPGSVSWATLDYGNVNLNAGNNTIEIKKSWGWTSIDYIELGNTGGGSSTVKKYEAEKANLTGVSTSTSVGGYSGTGHALGSTFKDAGDRIRFNVNAPSAGNYPLKIRYYNHGNGEKYQNVSINNGSNRYTRFPGSTSWATLSYGNVYLNAGNNTIDIKKSWGWTSVDYIEVGGNSSDAPADTPLAGDANTVHLRNYPNPFTQLTNIEFILPEDSPITLYVSDMTGKRIATLLNHEQKSAGVHTIPFDGSAYPAGMYYYTIETKEYSGTRKMPMTK